MASRRPNSVDEDTQIADPDRPTKRARLQPDPLQVNPPQPTQDADDEDEEDEYGLTTKPDAPRASDLYLDTINRAALDFDFEKLCSVSLSNINVYGCLVCGKYFQGRGRNSYAYSHSIHDDHHVFINLESTKVYVLPDNYPVQDPSLSDITSYLSPTFPPSTIPHLSSPSHASKLSYDLSGKAYVPGYVGLNNIKRNDHMNVIIQMLSHVPPLRDFLLLLPSPGSPATSKPQIKVKPTELLTRFSALTKKLWNPRLFKAQVSPHEFLQEVGRASGGRFRLESQGDPVEFLGWLLNRLHTDLGGKKGKDSSIIFKSFQGELRTEAQQVLVGRESDAKPRFDIDRDIKQTISPFLFLAVDLPPPPLFQDAIEKNIIPQVGIHSVLAKYDGKSTQESRGQLRRYKCQRLPPYIILHYKRFTKNQFVEEKNPTIVNFPLRGVDFREYLDAPPTHPPTLYDLLSNITHESVAGTTRDKEATTWKVHLRAGSGGGVEEKWWEVQDLRVQEIRKEMIFLGESVLQVWERRDGGR
ncbi:hypothetical protein JAAARDRAFT_168462 [Jaapia argillacea MUCL 33604]|uniref:USP domain-containing protein n=1 Tax=Jaapia argillacea MUCL 33604 TaxID=933084 RepID=A0A067QK89_9AGAM|nr:hypothetical protein JAAARDRAFT_168462 [Jaapia argillacea MUCL 33604]